jgi:hypothetical protein
MARPSISKSSSGDLSYGRSQPLAICDGPYPYADVLGQAEGSAIPYHDTFGEQRRPPLGGVADLYQDEVGFGWRDVQPEGFKFFGQITLCAEDGFSGLWQISDVF